MAEAPVRYLSRGYQGAVYVAGEGDGRVVIKQPLGRGLARAFRGWMLRREFAAYQRLAGVAGVPRCHELRPDGCLVLEYVAGEPFHESLPAFRQRDRDVFFRELLEIVLALHAAGVAHGDLKRRGNILVTPAGHPVLLDFGAAVVRRDRGSGLNRFLFRQLCRMDLNAWVKLKYRRRYDAIEPTDQPYYQPTLIEGAARVLRRIWRKLTGRRYRKAWRQRRAERRSERPSGR